MVSNTSAKDANVDEGFAGAVDMVHDGDLTAKQMNELRRAFEKVDEDGSGEIDPDELMEAMSATGREVMGTPLPFAFLFSFLLLFLFLLSVVFVTLYLSLPILITHFHKNTYPVLTFTRIPILYSLLQ